MNNDAYNNYLNDLEEYLFLDSEKQEKTFTRMQANEYYIPKSNFYVNAAQLIMRYRYDRGITQERLAELSGTSRDRIAEIERIAKSGKDEARSHDAYTLARIFWALGHDLGEVTIIK